MTTNRLMTKEWVERFKEFALYSQDGKRKDALCLGILGIANAHYYILEGEPRNGDFLMFGIVTGLCATEYGYFSLNEMAGIKIDAKRYGLDTIRMEEIPLAKPTPLYSIKDDAELQDFLEYMYDKD